MMRRELDMQCPIDFGTTPDCDCPYEHWHVGQAGTCLDIHFEADGSVHVTLDSGEWDAETTIHGAASLDDVRDDAFVWAASKIMENPHAD